jgi:S-phase kinase-associated protein 1
LVFVADQDENRIELTNVSSDVLKTIISYMTYHTTNGRTPADIKEIAKPIRSLEMRKLVEDSFDADLADGLTYKQIFDTILAANYMQIDPLLHLLCAKTATMIKNKSHDEIRTIFVDGTGSKATAQPGASS